MSLETKHLDDSRKRSRMFLQLLAVFGVLFTVLIVRLFYIQIMQGEYHHRLSLENMMRLKVIKAPRGRIYDRYGKLLVRNRASYSIAIYPYKVKDKKKTFDNLEKVRTLDNQKIFSVSELKKKYKKALRNRFDPTILKEDVGVDLASVIEEHTLELPGIGIETEIRREYPYGALAFHLLGYISGIPLRQFASLKKFGYSKYNLIGKMGIEKQYEELLRGKNGQEYVEVNAFGKELGVLDDMPSTPPVRGHDLYLTIDLDIQLAAEEAFPDSLKGALVAINPQNGEILAMLSSPRPDPNLFTFSSERRSKLWAKVALDPRQPLNNRAVQGTYPPGSTFKMVTAVAGLEQGVVKPETRLKACTGSFRFGRRNFRCWLTRGHGRMNVTQALMHSCDIYFYQLGLGLGAENINKYARMLGFGKVSGIDLPNEKAGMLLDKKSYNRKFHKRGWIWTRGMVLNLSIGQGQAVTPVQLANYIAALGNGKVLYKPYILKSIKGPNGREIRNTQKEIIRELSIKSETIATIRTALYRTVNERGGTGGRARLKNVPVGGKTGSAENSHGELTHALFVAYAPVDSPSIAISVIVENSGHGGSVAAPIADKVLKRYFEKFPYKKSDSTKAELSGRISASTKFMHGEYKTVICSSIPKKTE